MRKKNRNKLKRLLNSYVTITWEYGDPEVIVNDELEYKPINEKIWKVEK